MIIPPIKKSKIDNTIEITMNYLRESNNFTPEQRQLFTDFIDTLNRYKSQEYPELYLKINKESLNPLNKEQIPTNSNSLANCTPEDFDSAKKVLEAALDLNPDLHTSNTLQNFIKNELPKLEKQADAFLKEELINQTKNRFNLLLERASSSTDVSVIYKALNLIDSLAYPNFEWDITQVNLLYKKLND